MNAATLEQQARDAIESERLDRTAAREAPEQSIDRRLSLWQPSDEDRFSLDELTEPPPPRVFAVRPYLPDGCASILTGAGGSSKTGLAVKIALAICTGSSELFGEPVDMGRVLYVSAEDRRDTLHRHLFANTRELTDRQRRNVAENFHVKDVVGSGFLLTRHRDGVTETAPDVGQLIEYAQDIEGLRLVIFDTLSRLNGGEETNEDLARFVGAMERICVEADCAALALHHTGKAQMRADSNDQYSSRGGSALSDNARSVLNLTRVTAGMKYAPTNAAEAIAQGRLLRLSHVKSNYASPAPDRWLERLQTPHAARLVEFKPAFRADDVSETWERIEGWMRTQRDVRYPTSTTIEALPAAYGSRAEKRRAMDYAHDRGLIREESHPNPQGRRKTYLRLVDDGGADAVL